MRGMFNRLMGLKLKPDLPPVGATQKPVEAEKPIAKPASKIARKSTAKTNRSK